MKQMLGKLEVPDNFVTTVRDAGVQELPLTDDHADSLSAFPGLERHDPFDRMLLAQAAASKMTLLTSDRVLLQLAGSMCQDATL